MAKTNTVIQKADETPTGFYERLCAAARQYTRFDPETPENQRPINATLVTKSYPGIRRKLQKMEGFLDLTSTQMIEITDKVFVNQDQETIKEAEKKQKESDRRSCRKTALLAAGLGLPDLSKWPPATSGR